MSAGKMLLVLLALAMRVLGQEPAGEAQKVELKWRLEPARKILIDRSHTETRSAEITIPGQPVKKMSSRIQDRQRVVDWAGENAEGTAAGIYRRILRWDVTRDDGPEDPSFIGNTFFYTVKNQQTHAELADGVPYAKSDMDMVLKTGKAVCGYVPMPDSATVGEEIALDLKVLVPMFFLEDEGQTKRAKARLKVGTPKDGIVALTGTLEMFGEDSVAGIGDVEGETTANMEILWDTTKGFYKSIKMTGKSIYKTVRSEDGLKLDATSTFTIELTASDGAAADAAVKSQVKHRDNARVWKAGTLKFKLPSHWFVGKDELQAMELYSLLGTNGNDMRFIKIEEFAEADPKTALKQARATLEERHKTKAKSVKAATGEGFSIEYDVEGRPMRMEIYADKDRLVRLQWLEVKPLPPGAARDLTEFRKSLTRVP